MSRAATWSVARWKIRAFIAHSPRTPCPHFGSLSRSLPIRRFGLQAGRRAFRPAAGVRSYSVLQRLKLLVVVQIAGVGFVIDESALGRSGPALAVHMVQNPAVGRAGGRSGAERRVSRDDEQGAAVVQRVH